MLISKLFYLFSLAIPSILNVCNDVGSPCWSGFQGIAPSTCCDGLQCQPWLPSSGGVWNEMTPWFCLHATSLPDGSDCNYVCISFSQT